MRVIDIGTKYIGEKEIKGNAGFKNAEFQKAMQDDGWKKGEAWCAYFMEMIFEEAYPEIEQELDRLFSGSCVQTLNNFRNAGYEISSLPVLGSLMILQKYNENKAHWSGHCGLPTGLMDNSSWKCIEGNTNSSGSREGDCVAQKSRSLMYYPTGLRVAGFVLIREFHGIQV